MIIISWNVRGLGRPANKSTVRRLIKANKVDLLLLQETKIHSDIESVIFSVWGSRRCVWEWVPSDGASGGLIAIWNENCMRKNDVFKSHRLLAIKFQTISDDFRWVVPNINGPNEEVDRSRF